MGSGVRRVRTSSFLRTQEPRRARGCAQAPGGVERDSGRPSEVEARRGRGDRLDSCLRRNDGRGGTTEGGGTAGRGGTTGGGGTAGQGGVTGWGRMAGRGGMSGGGVTGSGVKRVRTSSFLRRQESKRSRGYAQAPGGVERDSGRPSEVEARRGRGDRLDSCLRRNDGRGGTTEGGGVTGRGSRRGWVRRRAGWLGLAAAALLALMLGASCGSGGSVEPQPTPTSTRSERVEQQTAQQQAARGQAAQEQVEETVAAAAENWRAVAPMARNVVGDPEAPVLIVEYSDFQ